MTQGEGDKNDPDGQISRDKEELSESEVNPPTEIIQSRMWTQQVWSGPLPPPVILAQYDEILPGLANRLVTMVELQAGHRREQESKVIQSDVNQSFYGLIAGVVVCAIFAIAGVIALVLNQPWAAGAAFAVPTATLVSVFVYSKNLRKEELKEKSQITNGPLADHRAIDGRDS